MNLGDPHISTGLRRICASVVQFVQVFRATQPKKMLPILREFDERQLKRTHHLPAEILAIPKHALMKAYFDREDAVIGLLPGRAVAIPANVILKIYTPRAVPQHFGHYSVAVMTVALSLILTPLYEEHCLIPTEDLPVPSLL